MDVGKLSQRTRTALSRLLETDSSGRPIPIEDRLKSFADLVREGRLLTFEPLLPLILNHKDKPYSLENHFPFSTLYDLRMPFSLLLKTGRQLSKSTNLAARGIVLCNTIPNFQMLFITPLFEQIRRFSSNYVRKFIQESPIRPLLSDATTVNNVLQRSFKNGAQMTFSFTFGDANRARGVPSDFLGADEIQNIESSELPIVKECLSHSLYALTQYSGTPLTLDNTIENCWQSSSQAEWFIQCQTPGCGHWNIPALAHDLEAMIGPYHDGISERTPGVVCSKCQKPISPRHGYWVHRYPERQHEYAGYHVPQLLLPLHYSQPRKWAEIKAKQQGFGGTTPAMFWNEVMGESYDTSTKLISMSELRAASQGNPNTIEAALAMRQQFKFCVLAVDWGGGGQEEVSFTTLALLGWTGSEIHCIWGKRLYTPNDHIREAREILHYVKQFRPNLIAHDFTGAGTIRETILVQAGVPLSMIMPMSYVRSAAQAPCHYRPASSIQPREHYTIDKTRTLLLTCNAIKLGHVKFFQYDFVNAENQGLIHDFLALIEQNLDSKRGSNIFMIYRNPSQSDDFAQAVNMGCTAIWHTHQAWPNLTALAAIEISPAAFQDLSPISPWSAEDY